MCAHWQRERGEKLYVWEINGGREDGSGGRAARGRAYRCQYREMLSTVGEALTWIIDL